MIVYQKSYKICICLPSAAWNEKVVMLYSDQEDATLNSV